MSHSGWFAPGQHFCDQPELRCDVNRNVLGVIASAGIDSLLNGVHRKDH